MAVCVIRASHWYGDAHSILLNEIYKCRPSLRLPNASMELLNTLKHPTMYNCINTYVHVCVFEGVIHVFGNRVLYHDNHTKSITLLSPLWLTLCEHYVNVILL